MKFFIKSLPLGCRFSIRRFGSDFDCDVPSANYKKKSIKVATAKIEELDANLWGTELLEPLFSII